MRILTVGNDIPALKELGKELLSIFPESEVIRETDALMAGKYAFNHDIDMVFAEAEMKRMNGLQLVQFVRHEHPDVKGYLIGTKEELSDSFLIFSEDVTGVLIYPFRENAIRDVIREGRP